MLRPQSQWGVAKNAKPKAMNPKAELRLSLLSTNLSLADDHYSFCS